MQGQNDIRGKQTLLEEPCSTGWVEERNGGADPVIESAPDMSTSKVSEVEVQSEGSTTVINSTREKNGSITTYTVDSKIDATAISKSQDSDALLGTPGGQTPPAPAACQQSSQVTEKTHFLQIPSLDIEPPDCIIVDEPQVARL